MYQVIFKPTVERDLGKLPKPIARRIIEAAQALAGNPRPRGSKKLQGGDDIWRIRMGHYRIVYSVDDKSRLITIARAGHRREVYRRM